MALKTGRAYDPAEVVIDYDACDACGMCIHVCFGAPLYLKSKKLMVDQSRGFGCIGCGQCVAVCPNDAVKINGRSVSPGDFFELPPNVNRANYDQLHSLLLARRSVRKFKHQEIDPGDIDRIIASVSAAPMGLPPSDVEIIVFRGRDKVQEFANDLVDYMYRTRWLFGPVMRNLLRPFLGKSFVESSKTFIYPVIKTFQQEREHQRDSLFYNAPLVMYFHASEYADPADPLVSATYAMLAASALGIGSCMIGTPPQFLKSAKKLKKKYGIGAKNHQGLTVIFGYPVVNYLKGVKRSLGKVTYY